ncbi:hypothetical protein COTS27_00545 [Spirochaetota bacterium]|nr:hypothetical protein COTS27_00545 [Spirochaetota bacterium]
MAKDDLNSIIDNDTAATWTPDLSEDDSHTAIDILVSEVAEITSPKHPHEAATNKTPTDHSSTISEPDLTSHRWIQTALQELACKIDFDPEHHKYVIKATSKSCISVSAFIDAFIPTFKDKEVAERVSDRDGVPTDEILEDWRIRRDYSVVRGTEFHLYVKTFLTTGRKKPLQTPINNTVNGFHRFWNKNLHRYQCVATEFILYDETLRLAGTIDSLFYHPKTNKYIIFDWKTNRHIRMKNNYHEKLLTPFDDLDACEYYKYSIQMTLYRDLLKRTLGLDVDKAFIIHFDHNYGHYKVIKTVDLAPRIDEALTHLPKLYD